MEGAAAILKSYQTITRDLVSVSNENVTTSKEQTMQQVFILCKNLFRSEKERTQNGRNAQMLT